MAGVAFDSPRRTGRRRPRLVSEINVTPLVDVMLVLLVIFMVTSPMLVSGVNIDLPSTATAPATGQDEPLSVTIDRQGQIYIQESPTTLAELTPKLRAISHEKFDTRIFVRGDKNVDYGKIIHVMAAINQAGFMKVALVTEIDVGGRR